MNLFLLITLVLSLGLALMLEASHDETTGIFQFVIDAVTGIAHRLTSL